MRTTENKRVFKLVKTSNYTEKMDVSTSYTIVKTITYPDVKDWCNHYIIKDDNGNEEEVREVEVVFAPNFSLPEEQMVNYYLNDNELYANEIYRYGGFLRVGAYHPRYPRT